MARRTAWRTGAVLLAAVLLVAGVWRLIREIPARLDEAGAALRTEAARLGLRVSFRDLRLNPLGLMVVLDDLSVDDAATGENLARAESVDVTLSPGRFLAGETPVSRIRVRNFMLVASESNRPLFERIRSSGGGKKEEPLPELLLLDGRLRLGPFGPLRRLEARLPELRIRSGRFLGRRVSAVARDLRGEIELPGPAPSNLSVDSLSADVVIRDGIVRFRRAEAEGSGASVRLSGIVDPEKETGDLKISGKADLGAWIAAGAPGAASISPYVRSGEVDFSAEAAGSVRDPRGSAKVTLKDGRFAGDVDASGEIAVESSGGRVRATSLKGSVWDGALAGSGWYDLKARRGEGTASLTGADLGRAPWFGAKSAWRPAGRGEVRLSVAGGPDRIDAAVAVSNPHGFERAAPGAPAGTGPAAVPVPLSAEVALEILPPTESVRVARGVVRAGGATLSGAGTVLPGPGVADLSGTFRAPAGKAADYGWRYPLAWKGLEGEWAVDWGASGRRIAAGLRADGLAMRALPPVPAALKVDGDPGGAVHFVADLPAGVAEVTATGTVTGPLSGEPPRLDAAVGVRRFDLSRSAEWVGAVLLSVGADPEPARVRLAGLAGEASADVQISVDAGRVSLDGAFVAPEVRRGELVIRGTKAEGRYELAGKTASWEAGASGEVGEGTFRVHGESGEAGARLSGTVAGLPLAMVPALLGTKGAPPLDGKVDVEFEARGGPSGWELPRLEARSQRFSVGGLTLSGANVDGALGASTGRLVATVAAPASRLEADVRRESGWPAAFTARADNVALEQVATALGLAAAPAGTASAALSGKVLAAELFAGRKPVREVLSDLRFSAEGAGIAMSGLSFGAVSVEGHRTGDSVSGGIRTRDPDTDLDFSIGLREPFPFELAGPFAAGRADRPPAPPDASGNGRKREEGARLLLEGRADVSGALRALERTAGVLNVDRLQYRNKGVDLAGHDIRLEMSREGVRWAGGTLQTSGNPLKIAGKVAWGGELDVRLEGAVPAAAIRAVTDVFERLDGTLRLDLRATGNLRNPVVVGTGRLEGGVFSFREYAQLFEAMSAEAVISRERIVFETIRGRSGGGYLDGRGELPLVFDGSRKMIFSIDFFDVRYPYPADLRPVVQGHVELAGPVTDFLVTGEVEVQSARYTKNVKLEPAVLDLRRRLVDVRARPEKGAFRVRLDIDVVADDTIHFENNLGKGDARGEFKVVGDTSGIIILGSFDITEGYLEYGGNRYDIQQLAVEFQDPRRNNPRLDGRVEAKVKEVTVTILLTGTLEKPEVDFVSDPPFSKNEIVALLALGVSPGAQAGAAGSVGGGEAAAVALTPLSGPVEERVTGFTGLNRFTIEPAFSQATQKFEPRFTVGKKIGERFTVNLSTTVGETSETSASAEYEFYKDMFLQGAWESGTESSEGDVGADLKIRYRYRQFKDLWRARD